jgi:hypothetical protein
MPKKLQPLEPRNLALLADLELEGGWRLEYFDSDGAEYIAIFAGQSAEVRARDYYDALERGTLDTRIAPRSPHQRKSSLCHRNEDGQFAERATLSVGQFS